MKIKWPIRSFNKYAFLTYQKRLIEQHYNFLTCSIQDNVLSCLGWVQPSGCKDKYKVKIEYVTGFEPRSTILFPKIDPCKEIHMYNDHSLCLHYPKDMPWNERIKVAYYTIPWVIEWVIFYELYLINGNEWKGRESPTHFKESEKNINKDKGL
ncbi:hypothetical protein [Adhaeribacter soli]|uniref:Type II CBASS E2 protein domain-containing protein n=1 Tax=Adhaeribacter soli TaxID=2607655 RepID=A0A5N1ISR2_9BACT|nr:hypothetical protein [Adhaeribacter soli]KAA9331150.1 hypothetical protein F0P94_14745 [Adhaeribacter soli]